MRLLHRADTALGATAAVAGVDPDELAGLYAFPDGGWLRTNFVASVDGAATGADHRSGSINNSSDKVVFDLLRALCDVVVVGERTARIEGYRVPTGNAPMLLVVSNRCQVPPTLALTDTDRSAGADRGPAVLVTREVADPASIAHARGTLGEDNVWLIGREAVDLARLKSELVDRGLARILCEGGPTLHTELLRLGVVDDIALTWVPSLVAGAGPRISHGESLDLDVSLRHLLEERGTLLGLWQVERS